jgi:hypothetical protein
LTSSRLELASCHHNDLRRLAMGIDDAVVACSLNKAEMTERGARWRDLAGALVERTPSERGQRLVFRREAGIEDELRKLAELEQECCDFAEWAVSADDGEVVLNVSGSTDEGVAAVQAMFRSLD